MLILSFQIKLVLTKNQLQFKYCLIDNKYYEYVKLGTEEGNRHFAAYVVNYLYPELKARFPNNAFVRAIGLRTYNYNFNHETSINISKKKSFNL